MASLVLSVIKYPHEFFKNQTVDEKFYSTIGSLVSKMVTRIKTSDADDYHLNNETMMSTVEDIVSVIGFAMECTVIDRKRLKIWEIWNDFLTSWPQMTLESIFSKQKEFDLYDLNWPQLTKWIWNQCSRKTDMTFKNFKWPNDFEISMFEEMNFKTITPEIWTRWPQLTSIDWMTLTSICYEKWISKNYLEMFYLGDHKWPQVTEWPGSLDFRKKNIDNYSNNLTLVIPNDPKLGQVTFPITYRL